MKFTKRTILVGLLSLAMFTVALTPALAIDLDADYLTQVETETDYGSEELGTTIGRIIKVILGFLGLLILILFIYAGFQWMTSAGDEEKIATAKKLMVAAVIGLLIVVIAYAATNFIIDRVLEVTGDEEDECEAGQLLCTQYNPGLYKTCDAGEWSEIQTACNENSPATNRCIPNTIKNNTADLCNASGM